MQKLLGLLLNSIVDSRKEPCGILIFLPGTQEIRRCIEVLKSSGMSMKAEILQLHANMPNGDQQLVFRRYSRTKIIVATNVAEVHYHLKISPKSYNFTHRLQLPSMMSK